MLVAPSLPCRTFNDMPQSGGFGLTSAGAYVFFDNVVHEALRVVTADFYKPVASATGQ